MHQRFTEIQKQTNSIESFILMSQAKHIKM